MITQKTKETILHIIKNMSAREYAELLKELEALEVEPETRFKKGDEVVVWNHRNRNIVGKHFKTFSCMDGDVFVTIGHDRWDNCAYFTEWQEYKGVKPELPEGVKGVYLKYKSGRIYSLDRKLHGFCWDNSQRAEGTEIIEFAYWMDE